jgi:hypothetical protein
MSRWLVFVICSLPFGLIQFTFDPETFRTAEVTDLQDFLALIPWHQIIALCVAGFLLMFFIQGYIVRIYRGTTTPPEFDSWFSLYLDGIRMTIVETVWFLPAYILLAVDLGILYIVISKSSDAESMGPLLGLLLASVLIGFVAVVLLLIGIFYSFVGKVRFARTGSIREGIRFGEINSMIRRIGFGTYIIALCVLWAVAFIFNAVTGLLSVMPFLGWAIVLVLYPFMTVFSARYISRLYDQLTPDTPVPVSSP